MLSSNGTLTPYLASPLAVHSPVFQHPLSPPSTPIAHRQYPDPLFREIGGHDLDPVSLRHGNRLGRRSLNLGGVGSPVALVHAMNQGTRRVVVHDNGTVATTTAANSLFTAFEVLFLCRVAAELGSAVQSPPCHHNGAAASSVLRPVLLLFLRSQRYLCVNRRGRVYSLAKRGNNSRRKVGDCVFQHEIVSSQYDTYYSHRHFTPSPPPPLSTPPSPPDVGDRRYLSVINSKVVTRKVSTAKHPPKTAFFFQVHLKNMAAESIHSDHRRLGKNQEKRQRKSSSTTTDHVLRTSSGRKNERRRTKTPKEEDSHLRVSGRTTPSSSSSSALSSLFSKTQHRKRRCLRKNLLERC